MVKCFGVKRHRWSNVAGSIPLDTRPPQLANTENVESAPAKAFRNQLVMPEVSDIPANTMGWGQPLSSC